MKLIICAVYDVISDRWLPPFCQQTKGQAIRGFMDEVNRPADDNILYKHPDDFVLHQIGEYDDVDMSCSRFFADEQKLISGRECKNVAAASEKDQLPLRGVK